MTRTTLTMRTAVAALAVAGAMSTGCTMKGQKAPPLSGPSEQGTSVSVSASPDVLPQDGASQSLVTVTVRDSNGGPLRNLSLRSEIYVGNTRVDFGSLSARNLVTDVNGRATLVYTAPPSLAGPAVDTNALVSIVVTPVGSDYGNAVSRGASIRLVPAGGLVGPPAGTLQAKFTFNPVTPADHQNVLFDATTSVGAPGNPITAYNWTFGDGTTGSGVTSTHAYDTAGTYVVSLSISDALNRSGTTSQSLVVTGGVNPSASFVSSPTSPRLGQTVNFNASASRPAPGRTIRGYTWDFGDGVTSGQGPQTSHDYASTGAFTVSLTVTDDAGRVGTTTGTVTVLTDAPTADFSFSPSTPTAGTIVTFNGSGSSAVPGRTIASWQWDFGAGTPSTGTGVISTSRFTAAGTYPVILTVTDSAGKVGRLKRDVVVLP